MGGPGEGASCQCAVPADGGAVVLGEVDAVGGGGEAQGEDAVGDGALRAGSYFRLGRPDGRHHPFSTFC